MISLLVAIMLDFDVFHSFKSALWFDSHLCFISNSNKVFASLYWFKRLISQLGLRTRCRYMQIRAPLNTCSSCCNLAIGCFCVLIDWDTTKLILNLISSLIPILTAFSLASIQSNKLLSCVILNDKGCLRSTFILLRTFLEILSWIIDLKWLLFCWISWNTCASYEFFYQLMPRSWSFILLQIACVGFFRLMSCWFCRNMRNWFVNSTCLWIIFLCYLCIKIKDLC